MMLPHSESIGIGFGGFSVDIVIKNLGSDPIPEFVSNWDRNIDLPTIEMSIYYPIELLKLLRNEDQLPCHIPDHGVNGNTLNKEWGGPPSVPDVRATTHRFAVWKLKTDLLSHTASYMKKAVINATVKIKNHLDSRALRIVSREETIKKSIEGLTTPEDPDKDPTVVRCSMIELT